MRRPALTGTATLSGRFQLLLCPFPWGRMARQNKIKIELVTRRMAAP